ncbi:MAG: CPBP family intramembrane glutamic endopeptidase [Flavitalea sp.]
MNKVVLIVIFVTGILFSSIFISFISHFYFEKSLKDGFSNFKSAREALLVGILLAPFLETLILQAAIIETAKKRMSPFLSCVLSALIFGSIHFYNIFYFIYGVVAGLLLAYLYYIGSLVKRGFLLTLIVHILCNLLAFIFSE